MLFDSLDYPSLKQPYNPTFIKKIELIFISKIPKLKK